MLLYKKLPEVCLQQPKLLCLQMVACSEKFHTASSGSCKIDQQAID